jgi:hypothetical protein
MEPSLAATLADLSGSNPEANVAAIKTAVANYLSEADPGSRIRTTEYFNHTFSPDLILSWGDDSAGTRRVFIRTDARESSLREDLDWVPADAPLFLPLRDVIHSAASSSREDGGSELATESRARGAMIASPSSLEELHASDPSARVTKLFSRAVVRGGRGVLDSARAREASETVRRGYEGAQEADASTTQAAVESIENLVQLTEATSVTRFLQAVWIGGGGSEIDFPGATGVFGALNADSLQLLLDLGDVGDDRFWSRVARNLTLERLVSLTVAPESERFQRLVEDSLSRLRGRAFAVLDETNEFLSDGEFRWYAREGFLGLQSRSFRAAFTPGNVTTLDAAGQRRDGDGLSVRTLLDRLEDSGLDFSELTFNATTGTSLTLQLAEPGNAANDALLADLTDPLENNSNAVSVVVSLRDGREIMCDLRHGRARGRTGAKYYVGEMLAAALPVLQQLTAAERETLGQLLDDGDATENRDENF